MARLNNETLIQELAQKYLILDESSPEYQNINSVICVKCENGHKIETTLKAIRMTSFRCPVCVGEGSKGFKNEPMFVPEKQGFRIVAFDNATQRMGVSVFDNGKLVYYGLLNFSDTDYVVRLSQIRTIIEDNIIPVWKPDFIQFEDVQHQNSYITYEILAQLLGILQVACYRAGIEYEKTKSSVWRSHHGINGKGRDEEKKRAIKLVKDMYAIDVSDDIAEAILIGKYRVDLKFQEGLKSLF